MNNLNVLKHYCFTHKNCTVFLLFLFLLMFFGCKQEGFEEPHVSLENYVIKDGFELQVAASEPFIEAPVTMDFDNKGRLWVVEMKGYMQNLEGTGDDMPNGRITILEDLDNDGVTDHSKVFLDSLVLPRAIAHVYGGLLYAEPPNLWFVDIKNDKPANRILVDSLYADGGNVEHQPNGLMMHIDNWIYNAKSNFRYQRKNGEWIKEPTSFRGQWGITKDNFGRLYYNTNSTQLIGDYVLPNTIIKNEYYKPKGSIGKKLTPDQKVYPLHATAVNRGYVKGVLNRDSLLVNVTSSCGPLIYRGDQFPISFQENAFVCVPEANVVKRNTLTFTPGMVSAKQAIEGKEFLASTDEGFRPVNLFNGPDGNMYVVDMHRGVIQDKAYLTPYLQKLYKKKKLDTIIGMGRVLRVVNVDNLGRDSININKKTTLQLIELLKSSNGWFRDRAQQLLINRNDKSEVSKLKRLLENTNNSIAQIHALYTLDGLNSLNYDILEKFLYSKNESNSISHALVLLEQFANRSKVSSFVRLVTYLMKENNAEIDLYVLNSINEWMSISNRELYPMASELSNKYKDNFVFQEALISSLSETEEDYFMFLKEDNTRSLNTNFVGILEQTLSKKKKKKRNSIFTQKGVWTDTRTAGYKIFKNLCATCHGLEGEGIENLAPPLKNSEYITKSSERLALVLLHGLSGPIHVNGKRYEINTTMPGLVNNSDFTNKDIQDIINYLNHAFPGEANGLSLEKIKHLRTQKPKSGGVFNEKELLELKFSE